MVGFSNFLVLLGRILIGLMFIVDGLVSFNMGNPFESLLSKVLMLNITAAHIIGIVLLIIQIAAGLLLVLGLLTRTMALILLIEFIAVLLIGMRDPSAHSVVSQLYAIANPEVKRILFDFALFIIFYAVSIISGLLLLIGIGGGRFSIDGLRVKKVYIE